ncbi:sensor histidine kinase [Streptomyces sp. WAC06614]|uniref:sensor histidine kinase n=1 Tax=Streptomyces sp. WAC06614 TaxID=2487416 RepID=UPI00163BC4B9|nr:histidine kinase [Streptomyces sp. WAC06614]
MSDQDRAGRPEPQPRGAVVVETLLTVVVLGAIVHRAVAVITGHNGPGIPGWDRTPLDLLVLAAAAVLTVTRRRHPVGLVAVGVACWLLVADPTASALAFYNLGLRPLPPRRTAALAAAGLTALTFRAVIPATLPALDAVISGLPTLNTAFYVVVAGALPLAVGLWQSARRALLAQLRRQLAQAEAAREREVAAARTAERSRIAGEMHDVVAHKVSLMVVHAGALEVSTTDPAVTASAGLIRESGREALQELRSVLGLLHAREDAALAPQPTLAQIDDLVRASRQAGVRIRVVTEGALGEVPDATGRAAYRIVQEALTNIHKHAAGARTTVHLSRRADALGIRVRNARPVRPPDGDFPRGGHGLVGLGERVELLGGTFSAQEQADGGFLVTATLPTTVRPAPHEHRTAA